MNFIEARRDGRGVHLAGRCVGDVAGATAHGELTVGIRPEHLRLAGPEQAPLVGVVELLEPLGAETLVHARVEAEPAMQLIVRVHGYPDVAIGAHVGLDFDPSDLRCF
jgi:ABC-type sugar transport system ATPase subunit